MIDFTDAQEVIEKCLTEIEKASRDTYDNDKADKTAALFLSAQVKVSFLIEDIEFEAKNSKNEITRLER